MDERSFEENILSAQSKLYRMAYAILWNSADASDAVQECVFKAWRKLALLKDESRFEPWITRILINESRNIQRKNKFRTVPYTDLEQAAADAPEDLGLQDALKALPEKIRLPLLLHYMDGYPLEAIAEIMRLPLSTIKGRLYQGRKQLKALMEREALNE